MDKDSIVFRIGDEDITSLKTNSVRMIFGFTSFMAKTAKPGSATDEPHAVANVDETTTDTYVESPAKELQEDASFAHLYRRNLCKSKKTKNYTS